MDGDELTLTGPPPALNFAQALLQPCTSPVRPRVFTRSAFAHPVRASTGERNGGVHLQGRYGAGAMNGSRGKAPSRQRPGDSTQKQRRSSFVAGRGVNSGLRAADRNRQGNKDTQPNGKWNRNCIVFFVTNLNPKTTEEFMSKHVLTHTGIKVRPEKLPMKYDNYCSFLIQCSGQTLNALLDPDVWPAWSKFKRFYT